MPRVRVGLPDSPSAMAFVARFDPKHPNHQPEQVNKHLKRAGRQQLCLGQLDG